MITAARWISLIAAFFWGAVAEYHLGIAVGADVYTACLLPLTLDVYGFAAMKSARTLHVAGALVTMFGAQTAAHLLALGSAPEYMTALTIVVSAVPPSVSLACHRLGVKRVTVDAAAETPDVISLETVRDLVASQAMPSNTVDALPATPHREWKAAAHTAAYSGGPVDASVDASPVIVDAPAERTGRFVVAPVTVDAPVETPVADVTRPVSTVDMTRADYAREGARLIAAGHTKTYAAETLGISRQWLHACMRDTVNA